MSFGFGFGFPKRLTSGGGLSPSLYLDLIGTGVLPSTVTFSRGTNATLTDSNGRVAWAPHNLLTNSEDFEAAAWSTLPVNVSVSANTTAAPDGTTTADTLTETAATGGHYLQRPGSSISFTASTTYTYSVYAKNNGRRYLQLYWGGGASSVFYGNFDLQTGVVGTTGFPNAAGSSISSSIVDAGNGWYRCVLTMTMRSDQSGGTSVLIFLSDSASATSAPSYAGNGTSGVFIWGAQLNVANAPVNLLTYSENLNGTGWSTLFGGTGTTPTITSNYAAAPDGTITASRFVGTRGASNTTSDYSLSVSPNGTVSSGASYVGSVYIKSNTGSNQNVTIYVVTGAAVQQIVAVAGSTWTRVAPATLTATTTPCNIVIGTRGGSYGGDQSLDILVWGAQLNTGSTALPYVATTSSIYLPPAYNSTTPKNLLGYTQEPENAAWTKSNSYVQQNLLTWSQDFDNAAWTRSSVLSVSANASVAPDGTTTADLVTASGGVQIQLFQIGLPISNGTQYTATCYFKAGTSTWAIVNLYDTSAGNKRAWFNLTTGTVGTQEAGVTASIQTAANGFYRCTVTRTVASVSGGVSVEFSDADGSQAITAGRTMTVWGAQLVQGSTAGDYVQTTSAAAPTRYLNWDGTLTGRKLVTTSGTIRCLITQTETTATLKTATCYVKAAEWGFAGIGFTNGAGIWSIAVFNLSTGQYVNTTQYSTPAISAYSITPAGSGWYRISATITGSTSAVGVMPAFASGDIVNPAWTGDGTSGIYVSDFQLSNSASVDPYVYNPQAAAASAAFYGPRFDYNPTTLAANGLLIEEQRTNLLTYSEDLTNAAWSQAGGAATISGNVAVAPDGTTTADKIVSTVATSYGTRTPAFTSTAAAYTQSAFCKADGFNYVKFIWSSTQSATDYAVFNLTNGTITGGTYTSASITPFGNGWYRCSITSTLAAVSTYSNIWMSDGTLSRGSGVAGDGTSGILVWGAQVEAGSFATSYIPTVASQVTRNADSASMLGDNFYTWYNPNEGSFTFRGSPREDGSVSFYTTLLSASPGNTIANQIGFGASSSGSTLYSLVGGSSVIIGSLSSTPTAMKLAMGYAPNSLAASKDGGAAVTTGTVTLPGGIDRLFIGGAVGAAGSPASINGVVQSIGYYKTRLPDLTLQALTT